MGSLLLAAGAPGKRYALPHASIMIHQPSKLAYIDDRFGEEKPANCLIGGGYTGQAS